ncbi:MAG: hypothetical protein ACRCYO_20410 [Bacteroidia bacterium]
MKKIILPLACFAAFFMSCSESGVPVPVVEFSNADSVLEKTRIDSSNPAKSWILDELLQVVNEQKLIELFGANRVVYDTIRGPEGTFTMGTKLMKGTSNEVEIIWYNDTARARVASVKISKHFYDKPLKDTLFWKTKAGVLPGMGVEEVQKINGNAFGFSGLGWDYGGAVIDWNGGSLANSNVFVQLDVPALEGFSEAEMTQFTGEQTVMSNLPILKRVPLKVTEVILNAVKD